MTTDDSTSLLIAVDIGNSRIKLGRFDRTGTCPTAEAAPKQPLPIAGPTLPEPSETVKLPLLDRAGEFDADRLAAWCGDHVVGTADWLISSVHRGAAEKLETAAAELAKSMGRSWPVQRLTFHDVPLAIDLDAPERVGIDRLLAAVAADRLRRPGHGTIVVDLGTAITVDLLTADGAFAGGAILPGLAMSARALEEQTDALPRVAVDNGPVPPEPLGKSTGSAIESGLFWGAVGAIRELIERFSAEVGELPSIVVTGGGATRLADTLARSNEWPVRTVPHLVLAGIALADESCAGKVSPGKAGR